MNGLEKRIEDFDFPYNKGLNLKNRLQGVHSVPVSILS